MYLRRYGKKVDGEEYGYWALVESVRTARGPRQRVVATIGKLPDFDKEERGGWEEIGRILTGKPQPQDSLFEKTALDDLLGVPTGRVNDDRLYRALDASGKRQDHQTESGLYSFKRTEGSASENENISAQQAQNN